MKKQLLSIILVMQMFIMLFPITTFAATDKISGEFKKILNSDGKLVLDCVKPSNEEESMVMCEYFYIDNNEKFIIETESFNSDFSECDLYMNRWEDNEEKHRVEIVYNYDKNIEKLADEFASKFPKDRRYFYVKDLEFLNYLVNENKNNQNSDVNYLSNYSGELKGYLKHSNFTLNVDCRAGDNEPFFTVRAGMGRLMHKDTTYFYDEWIGAKAEHIIYVPESTGDTAEALMAAAQKRVNDYIGKNKIKISLDSSTVGEYYNGVLAEYDRQLTDAQATLNNELQKDPSEQDAFLVMDCQFLIEQIPQNKQNFIDSFKEDGERYFLNKAQGGYLFKVEVNGDVYRFIIVKDDANLQLPTYKTVDLSTDVQISSSSSSVPLDTIIQAEKLESGKEYERIIKLLDVKNNETFDLRLFSNVTKEYVTKLENGEFEVRIPIPEKLRKKSLTVYFVDEQDKTIEYKVSVKDDYAIFVTDHFSIYTLAEVGTSDSNQILSPSTEDSSNNVFWSILLLVSSVCLLGSYIVKKEL